MTVRGGSKGTRGWLKRKKLKCELSDYKRKSFSSLTVHSDGSEREG